MIWFFLAGWVAGAIGMVLFARWWLSNHVTRVTLDDLKKEIEEEKSDD